MQGKGKQFEDKVRQDLSRVEGVLALRLPDQWNGYRNSSNPCDFIVYKKPIMLFMEVKSRQKNLFNLCDFAQYPLLLSYSGIDGIYPIVVIWFIDYDMVLCFPITSIEKMRQDGLKSINVKKLDTYKDKHFYMEIPSIKRRIFMDSDYSCIFNYFWWYCAGYSYNFA